MFNIDNIYANKRNLKNGMKLIFKKRVKEGKMIKSEIIFAVG